MVRMDPRWPDPPSSIGGACLGVRSGGNGWVPAAKRALVSELNGLLPDLEAEFRHRAMCRLEEPCRPAVRRQAQRVVRHEWQRC